MTTALEPPAPRSEAGRRLVAGQEALLVAETCRYHLDAYGVWVHGHRPARHHRLWIERLTALVAGRAARRKLLIVAPPGHAKSTWLSLIFPPWHLGIHPDESVLFLTSADTMAGQFSSTVRTTLAANARHALAFPDERCRPDPARGWSSDGLYLGGTPAGSKDPSYRAVGYGASVIGARAHGIILDDPLTQEQAQSEVEQQRAKAYFDLTVDSRLHPDGWMVAIMTRWHELDLASHLMGKPEWDTLVLPALGDSARGQYAWGQALWPERFSEAWLEAKRADIGGPRFACLYQGDPTAMGGDVFREPAWFRPLPPGLDAPASDGTTRREQLVRVQYYDLAFSAKASADYTCAVTVGRLPGGPELYVLDVWRERLDESRLDEAIVARIAAQRPHVVGIEEGAYKQAATRDLVRRVNALLAQRGIAVPVVAVKVTQDKVFRARLPAQRAEAGFLYVDRTAPWWPSFLTECLGFPRAANDDMVDALSGAVQLAIERGGRLSRQGAPIVFTMPGGAPSADDPFAVPRANAAATRAWTPTRPANPRANPPPRTREDAEGGADLAAIARGQSGGANW